MKGIDKYKMWGKNNANALPPQYSNLGPLYLGPINHHPVTPHATWRHPGVRMGPRGPATCTRHIHAMQALAWVHVVLPRGLACHVASTRVPRCATLARGSFGKNTPFCHFKGIKIKINSRKIQKNSKNS